MGVVYKAEDLKLKRTVALKFLPPEWSRDPDARARFMREAQAASALDHPNICVTHEIDETDEGRLFIAMAFYEGDTLKKRLEQGPLPINEAIGLAIQVAEGLQRAHEAGIVHRDIKPANVIITERGEAKIVDFGLAKLAGEFGLTRTGSTVGTPHYMSPEQARGDEVGPATDIWSLAVVVYDMVTGQRPFQGANDAAVVRAILDDKPKAIRNIRPDAPPLLERVVHRALEKDSRRRYSSVQELLDDLTALQTAEREAVVDTLGEVSAVSRRHRWLAVAAPIVGVLLLAVVAVLLWSVQRAPPAELPPDQPKRIVVLPFDNLGPPEDEYFAAGMTEEITSRLASVSGLIVISRTSALEYDRTGKTLAQIGDDLNVGYVVEGSVRWSREQEGRGRVRITPQLIRVADDAHMWSERYDRVIEDIFEVQSDIARRVIDKLEVTLLEPEQRGLETAPTENMDAYQAYLRGLPHLNSFDREEFELATEMFERAVTLDPDFAIAYAALSESHSVLYHSGFDSTQQRLAEAKRAVDRALELEPDLPEGHRAMGYYHYWCHRDYQQALEQFTIAAAARPSDSRVLEGIAFVHRRQGRWRDVLAGLERVQQLKPQDSSLLAEIAITQRQLRKYQEAERLLDRAIALAPDRTNPYFQKHHTHYAHYGPSGRSRQVLEAAPKRTHGTEFFWYRQELGERNYEAALEWLASFPEPVFSNQENLFPRPLGECECLLRSHQEERARDACDAARIVLEEASEDTPEDPRVHAALGLTYALLGRKQDAMAEGERAVALWPVSKDALLGPHFVIDLARIYAHVGEPDAALDRIEHLLSIPSELSVARLRLEPYWDPLRDHPRFQEILEKYGEER
jgi:TolB-like protein/Flp pilus assembly protein TadD